jgi:hypothetical protein
MLEKPESLEARKPGKLKGYEVGRLGRWDL